MAKFAEISAKNNISKSKINWQYIVNYNNKETKNNNNVKYCV